MQKRTYRIIYMILAGLLLLVLIKGVQVPYVDMVPSAGMVTVLNDRMEKQIRSEGEKTYYEYSCIIPKENEEGQFLSVMSYWSSMKIFLDGEEIYAYEDIYSEKGVNRQWIELPLGTGGSRLVIQSETGDSLFEKSMEKAIYIGRKENVYLRFLRDNLYALVFAGLAFVMSLIIHIWNIGAGKDAIRYIYRGMDYLAAFILLAGIWILTDSGILQMLTGRAGLAALISFLSFMIMPFFLIRFIREMMLHKKRELEILGYLYLANTAGFMLLYLLRLLPMYKTLLPQHILILLSVCVVWKNGLEEIRCYDNQEMKKILTGFGILAGFAALALIEFYSHMSIYPYLYCIGILVFVFCMVMAAVRRMYYYMERSAAMSAYKQLAYKDAMTDMGNRAAFMQEQEQNRYTPSLAYIMIDINNLKKLNDQYGHQEGDRLIIDVAECLCEGFGGIGKGFRIGGDEFVVIIKDMAEQEIEQVLAALEKRIQKKNHKRSTPIEIAVGYAIRRENSITVEELFDTADKRMYKKKQEMKKKDKCDREEGGK